MSNLAVFKYTSRPLTTFPLYNGLDFNHGNPTLLLFFSVIKGSQKEETTQVNDIIDEKKSIQDRVLYSSFTYLS